MTSQTKTKNLSLYFKKLEELGVPTEKLKEMYQGNLLNATFTNINDHGNAYDGSFLEIILRILTPYAIKINEILPEEKRVDKDTLVKICLLHQISKCVRLIPNDNAWEVEKRGMLYKYDPNLPSVRGGLHSLSICQECGIEFTLEEVEAMVVNDRDLTDDQYRWYSSILSSIVRQANELTYLTINSKTI